MDGQLQCLIPLVLIFEIMKFASWKTACSMAQTCRALHEFFRAHASSLKLVAKIPLRSGERLLNVAVYEKEETTYISYTFGTTFQQLTMEGEISDLRSPLFDSRLLCTYDCLYALSQGCYELDLTKKNQSFVKQRFGYTISSPRIQYCGAVLYLHGKCIQSVRLTTERGSARRQQVDTRFIAENKLIDFALSKRSAFGACRGLVLTENRILHRIETHDYGIFRSVSQSEWKEGNYVGVTYDSFRDRLLVFSFRGRRNHHLVLFTEHGRQIGEVEFEVEPLHEVTEARVVFPSRGAHFYAVVETAHQKEVVTFALKILDKSKVD